MDDLVYPKIGLYKLPKKNILVISCMDLRLTDNMLHFLNFDNLQNRYDHVILAGTSLFCTEHRKELFTSGSFEKYGYWKKMLMDHVQLAIDLHQIKDVYIFEHEDCGAYSNFLSKDKVDLSSLEKVKACHKIFGSELAKEINQKVYTEQTKDGSLISYQLHAHCFFIDLRGNVELLFTTNPLSPVAAE